MSLTRLIFIVLIACTSAGCAGPDGSSDAWSDIAVLPNITNVPPQHYTEDGFDPPFDYY